VLATLHAPDGIVGVLGNHDYDYDAPSVARWLTRCGVHVLVNECVTFERDGARLAIGGVDDYEYGSIDVYGGCAEIPADVPRIVLSHNPDGVLRLDPRARVDLVLAGHTHGGQLVLPWFGAPARHCTICDADCASGWVRRAPVPLYVSAGAGALIPFRLGSRPEVVLVRLVRH
jgi:predicted MPP superfamily phosphohydrolase